MRSELTIEELYDRLEDSGWLGYLSTAKRSRLKRELAEWRAREPRLTHLCVATGKYDLEMIEDDSSYPALLQIYRKASNGVFDVTDVASDLDRENEIARISFTLRGRRFETSMSLELGDYVAEDFQPFVNGCLKAVGIEQRFHALPSDDQFVHLAFVPTRVFDQAHAAGLLGLPTLKEPKTDLPRSTSVGPRPRRGTKRHYPLRGEGLPLPLLPRRFLFAAAVGVLFVVLAIAPLGVSGFLLAGVGALVGLTCGGLMLFLQHPFAVLTAYQWMMYAFFLTQIALLAAHVDHGRRAWLPVFFALGCYFLWQGARASLPKT